MLYINITMYMQAIAMYVHEQHYIYRNSTVIYVNSKRNIICVHVYKFILRARLSMYVYILWVYVASS